MQLVFMGSPPFATPVLQRVLESPHRVLALVTRPDRPKGRGLSVAASPLADLARERAIPVLQPTSAKDPSFVAELRSLAPDVLLVASYGEILKQDLLDLAPKGALNVHASLLPLYRGASPIQAAILAGDAQTGVTVQRMALALDQGDVLLALPTPILPHETAGELLARLAVLGGEAAVRALDLVESGEAKFVPQDHARATHATKIGKVEGRVDWTRSAEAIERHVRAMTPWPGARTALARTDVGEAAELVLLDARAVPVPEGGGHVPPGTVIDTRRAFLVAAGTGSIEIRRLRPAGKAPMDGLAWLRGARVEPGARFRS
jgi:methionyl-tRNA formyltransferase